MQYHLQCRALTHRVRAPGSIAFDEGPDVGGPVGPYVQSERKPIYAQHASTLVHRSVRVCAQR